MTFSRGTMRAVRPEPELQALVFSSALCCFVGDVSAKRLIQVRKARGTFAMRVGNVQTCSSGS